MEELRLAQEAGPEPISDATRLILEELAAGRGHEFSVEELLKAKAEADQKLNPHSHSGCKEKKFVNFAFTNLSRDYEQMLAITSVASFLFCMAEEHFVRDAALYPNPSEAKATVLRFLNHFFEYDPNKHVAEMRKKSATPAGEQRFKQHAARVRELARCPEKLADLERAAALYAEREAELVRELPAEAAAVSSLKAQLQRLGELHSEAADLAASASPLAKAAAEALSNYVDELAAVFGAAAPDDDDGAELVDGILRRAAAAKSAAAAKLDADTQKLSDLLEKIEKAKELHVKGQALADKAKQYSQTLAAYDKPLPYDTYYWFSAYFRSNYAALREATEALYPVRSYFDEMLTIYDGVYHSEDEAKIARRLLGGEQRAIHTTQVGVVTIVGPYKTNTDRTEFEGEGWEVFKGIMEFHKREAQMGQQMLANIAKVRKAREAIDVADPQKVQEFAQFCQSLRDSRSSRALTEKEQAVLSAADNSDPDPGALESAVHDLRSERERVVDDDIVNEIPDDCLATQLIGMNPDTGALLRNTVYFKSEERQAEERAASDAVAASTAPTIESSS